jgi:hypothetical protein
MSDDMPLGKTIGREALRSFFRDGMTIMFGGFMGIGTPDGLVAALRESGVGELTLIGNDTAFPDTGVGPLISAVSRLIRTLSSRRACWLIISSWPKGGSTMQARERIAQRVAQELKDGDVVNLGIGLPTLVPAFLPPDVHLVLQSENGFVGLGSLEGEADPGAVDAGGRPCGLQPGVAMFDSAMSFCLIRGGHVDVTVLGGGCRRSAGQSRQLDGAGKDGARHGEGHGSGDWCPPRDRGHGALHP